MVREDFPGGRLLSLRRRRSRLPWIYLVYQQAEDRGVEESSSLLDAETPERRTPRARRDRCLPHLPPVSAQAAAERPRRDRAPDAGQSTGAQAPWPALPFSP